jgi:hypothetical protein
MKFGGTFSREAAWYIWQPVSRGSILLLVTYFIPRERVSITVVGKDVLLRLVILSSMLTIPNADNYELFSFDVTSLYPSVPLQESIEILQNILITEKHIDPLVATSLINDLRLLVKQNYFNFEDHYYLLKDGSPMGSPISGYLAEVWLQEFEKTVITPLAEKGDIKDWKRYVDDTAVIIPT